MEKEKNTEIELSDIVRIINYDQPITHNRFRVESVNKHTKKIMLQNIFDETMLTSPNVPEETDITNVSLIRKGHIYIQKNAK